jgi:4-methyl-5(b-hydroxyethyl)-thiazole monophosphate biosynthesis
MNVIVPLAEGFEEIEAVTIIDVLRRASIPVTTVSLGSGPIRGVHGIMITAEKKIEEIDGENAKASFCPVEARAEKLKRSPAIVSLFSK